MLDLAVEAAVAGWMFRPFMADGHPVSEQVAIAFSFANGQPPKARFVENYAQTAGPIAACEAATVRSAFDVAAATCGAALQEAEQRGKDSAWAQARAGWLLARALVGLGRVPDALPRFDRALEVIPKDFPGPTTEDRVVLLADTARAYDASGDVPRALTLYSQATTLMAKQLDAFALGKWVAMQRAFLTEEADTLQKAGRTKDAGDRRKRAAKLK